VGGEALREIFEAVLMFLVGSVVIFLGVIGLGLFLAALP